MKKFFLQLLWLAALLVIGFLAWRNTELIGQVRHLRGEIRELERDRRESRRQLPAVTTPPATNAVALAPPVVRSEAEEQTAELRGLSFVKPVNYQWIERSELRAFLLRKVREQYPEQELNNYGRSLAAVGLVPDGTDLLPAILSLYDDQIAAFYLPEERALYTFKEAGRPGMVDRMLLVHELTHALQDQNFDLTKFALKAKDNDDLVMAQAALLEGDATVLMTQWSVRHADPAEMGEGIMTQNTKALQEAPEFLRARLLFPYIQGTIFVQALRQAGGQAAVDEALRHPPSSTQQVLHPELFLKNRRDPVKIELLPLPAPQWRRIGNNVLGELGMQLLLQSAVPPGEMEAATRGWNGDRYQVYERGTNGPTGLVWVSVWHTPEDAGRFAAAYGRRATERNVDAHITRRGKYVWVRQSSDEEFFAAAETITAQLD
jgi:hypothetical protein